jgi:RimJ/RimL family protein N-acetyltransferase
VTTIETPRLLLRPFDASDLDALADVFAAREVWEHPLQRGLTRDETAAFLGRRAAGWAERGFDLWAAVERASGALMGFVGLSVPDFLPEILPAVEVGWRLHPRHWGHGYATEGGDASLRFGFEKLRLERIVSVFEPANVASGAVMARLGMTVERDTVHPAHGVPVRVCAITRDEWAARGPLPAR